MAIAREAVSRLTIARLAVYYSALQKMKDDGELVCASTRLGRRTGVASSVIRRDLAYFGGFGTKGVGYEIDYLMSWIGAILGYTTVWNTVLVGRGLPFTGPGSYYELLPPGFIITAAIDLDRKNHGSVLPGLNLPVHSLRNAGQIIKSQDIAIGLIAVPPDKTQQVANMLVKAGIKGIASFSASSVTVPDTVALSQINVTSCLSQLSYNLSTTAAKNHVYLEKERDLDWAFG